MKTVNVIIKVVAALAAVAGVVYVVATYGDKIVAWAKKLLGCCGECCECDEVVDEAFADEPEVAEEVEAVEEIVAEEADLAEEVPAADEEVVVASESDFEG